MTAPTPGIFRQEALDFRLRHRGRRPTEVIFPRLMARPVRVALWVALALLVAGCVAAFLPAVPVTGSGMAVVVTDADGGAPRIAVLMPAEHLDRLAPGAGANVFLGARDRGLPGAVVAVEPEPLAPDEVRRLLAVPETALAVLPSSVAVAWVAPAGASEALGGFGWADIEIGTTPAGAYLPLVGGLFEE